MPINKITAKSIKDAEIVAADIAPGTITDAKIATGTITNAKLAGSIANAKLSNTAITINGTSIALGASGEIVAGTDWQAVTVADGSTTLTAVAGRGYFLDTNAGVIQVNFPSSPTRGDTIVLMDYAGHFALNNVLLNLQGQNIDSTEGSFFKLDTNNTVAEFVYVDSNTGWFAKLSQAAGSVDSALIGGQLGLAPAFTEATGGTVTTSGDYKIHTFTGDGNFVVGKAGNFAGKGTPDSGPNVVDYLVVAGGGGGGGGTSPSGGQGGAGAGGFRESRASTVPGSHTQSPHSASPLAATTGISVTEQTYPVTVGAGGVGGASSPDPYGGTNGSNSVFSTITSTAGGRGKGTSDPTGVNCGVPGGSGGGTGYGPHPSNPTTAGSGNTPPVSPPQGNDGGSSIYQGPQYGGSGGGGATQAGADGTGSGAGAGGNGATTSINASSVAYAGGGGGGQSSGSGASGGSGDGGNGGPAPGAGTAGGTNKGGGGGGGSRNAGGNGGSGIVILRYKYQ